MLKKLRIKFIALNMGTVAIVLATVFTIICAVNYQQSANDVRNALDGAIMRAEDASHNNAFPIDENLEAPLAARNAPKDTSQQEDLEKSGGMPPEIGGKKDGFGSIIPVTVYAMQADGTLQEAGTENTASISDDILSQAASLLAEADEGTGALDALGLCYEKRTVGETVYLAFADISAANSWQSLAITLGIVGVAALAAFFVISVFFSQWALGPIARAWSQQRQFVADASHDLKTPLTVILANTSILMAHPEKSIASQSQWIESTEHEARSMQGLVSDLLLLAQLDEGTAHTAFEQVSLTDLVESEALQFESIAFERSIELKATLDDNVELKGNPTQLRRLVATLLDNACKYANDEGCVEVRLKRKGQRAEIAVRNTGAAIPAEDLPHIFDRFYRTDKARTHDDSGYGLGLSIAYSIVKEHGGTLTAASSAEHGTTFTATLPLKAAPEKEIPRD